MRPCKSELPAVPASLIDVALIDAPAIAAAGAMSISGALRGAGDTKWPGVITLVLSWTIIVGGGWAFVFLAPGLNSLGPWIAAAVYIVLLATAMLVRFMLGHWKTIKLVDRPSPTA